MKRILKRCLLWSAYTLLALVVAIGGIILWDLPPASVRQYMSLKYKWDESLGNRKATAAERQAAREQFADQTFQLAQKYPGTAAELAALILVDQRASDTPVGKKATEVLLKRIQTTDLKHLAKAFNGFGAPCRPSATRVVPAVFARVKQELDDPETPYLLAQISSALAWETETHDPPDGFKEIADLIVDRFADSPRINNFCSLFGNGMCSPRWAAQFEQHLKRVLAANQDFWVRCTASMALAQTIQSCEDRQAEAEQKFKDFLSEYDHAKTPPQYAIITQQFCDCARMQLEAMEFAAIGRPAPEIAGLDLSGQQMSLSEYQGKVVVLTFWATWCGPCMKLVRHEKDLANHFAGQNFAIVGVNGDDDPTRGEKAESEKGITWRSFRDKRAAGGSISDDWKALFPTVYVIDHNGIVRHRYCGSPNPEQIQKSVTSLLETATAG